AQATGRDRPRGPEGTPSSSLPRATLRPNDNGDSVSSFPSPWGPPPRWTSRRSARRDVTRTSFVREWLVSVRRARPTRVGGLLRLSSDEVRSNPHWIVRRRY